MKQRKIAGLQSFQPMTITIGKTHKKHKQQLCIPSSNDSLKNHKKRIMNYRLIQIQGVPKNIAIIKLLGMKIYFGRYGQITNMFVSQPKQKQIQLTQTMNVYVTYQSELNSSLALLGIHGIQINGQKLNATFGTNRYCQSFLDEVQCQKQKCFYLHHWDTENQSTRPCHAREKHLERAFNNIKNNLNKIICLEMQEANINQNNNYNIKLRTVNQILQRMIKKGILNEEQYQRIRSKGKFACEKIVKLKKSFIQTGNLTSSVIIVKESMRTDQDQQFPSKLSNSVIITSTKNHLSKNQDQIVTQSSENCQDTSSEEINNLIAKKILSELKKKRCSSRLDFAKKSQTKIQQLSNIHEDSQSKKVRQTLKSSLLKI